MKIAYQWLQEYVATTSTPEDLATRLRSASCEVESIEEFGRNLEGLTIGKVLAVEPHPNADRLRIATVSLGNSTARIVCGAPNLGLEQTVVVALPGTTIYPLQGSPVTIQLSTIRGETSEGMLCAREEIGLQPVEEGIMILPDSYTPGTGFAKAILLDDIILDLEITPNRPDLLSYLGVAREVAALEKRRLQEPPISSLDTQSFEYPSITVQVEDSRLCKRYSAICLDIISVGPSPLWLQSRLQLSGIKPTNIVVDITNYVMLELGQPLHAFDLDALGGAGSSVIVRAAKPGETLATLNAETQKLSAGDLIIASGTDSTPWALAGIMGGSSTAISPTTTHILLESATFSGSQIRKTSRTLGLRTEASMRFEKGLDPEATMTALKRAAHLLQELAGAQLASPVIDQYSQDREERPRIHLSFSRIQQVLGTAISTSEAKSILTYLGFQIPVLTKSSIEIVPPWWRRDVMLPEDVIEELIRIWGFDRLPATLPAGPPAPPQRNAAYRTKQLLKQALAQDGYHETIHLSFTSARLLELAGFSIEQCIKLPNPLSQETAYLVPSHLIHFLENCGGVNRAETELCLFEIGKVFSPSLTENLHLSFLLRSSGNAEPLYRKAKASIERILKIAQKEWHTIKYVVQDVETAGLQAGSKVHITVHGRQIGQLGMVANSVVAGFKIKRGATLIFCEIDMEALLALPTYYQPYQAPSLFPNSSRDLTIIIDRHLPAERISSLLENEANPSILDHWELSDSYTGSTLPENKKSVTIGFVYNARSRTLTDAEVEADQQRLIALFQNRLSAEVK